jgi:hypothetical protein
VVKEYLSNKELIALLNVAITALKMIRTQPYDYGHELENCKKIADGALKSMEALLPPKKD